MVTKDSLKINKKIYLIDFFSKQKFNFFFFLWSQLNSRQEDLWIKWNRKLSITVISLVSQSCLTLCKPTDCSLPGSSVHGDSPWQEHWSGLPCPPPGDLLNPGTEPRFHPLQVDSLLSEPPGNSRNTGVCGLSLLQAIFPTQELSPSLLHWVSLYSLYFSYLWTISSLFLLSLFYESYLQLLSVPLILLDLMIFSSSFSHPSWYTPLAFYSFFLGFCHLCTQFCEPWIYSLSPSHAHKFQIKISDSL